MLVLEAGSWNSIIIVSVPHPRLTLFFEVLEVDLGLQKSVPVVVLQPGRLLDQENRDDVNTWLLYGISCH